MPNNRIEALLRAGVSIWLDDLNRPLVTSGGLQRLIEDYGVSGITSNPTIFANALADGSAYREQMAELARDGASVEDAAWAVMITDVQAACDILMPVYDRTKGQDGRVSLEVDPRLARDTDGTVAMAQALWQRVNRPNLMIKVPATLEGLPAITALTAEGISVNVTLIFSLERYRWVMNAYLSGLEQAREAGVDLSTIRSVASFFVSRVDTEIDPRLDDLLTEEAIGLQGLAAVANARLAYRDFDEVFSTPRWAGLKAAGAHVQRPLWASTGVKNPEYKDTLYVVELVAPNTVNTMPRATLDAIADHGEIFGERVRGRYTDAAATLDALDRLGISYAEVTDQLEREGVAKFEKSWQEMLATLERAMAAAKVAG